MLWLVVRTLSPLRRNTAVLLGVSLLFAVLSSCGGDDLKEEDEREAEGIVAALREYLIWNAETFVFNGLLEHAADVCAEEPTAARAASCLVESDGIRRAWRYLTETLESGADRISVPNETAVALRRLAYDYNSGLRAMLDSDGDGLGFRTREQAEEMRNTAREARIQASLLQSRCSRVASLPSPRR